jgi:hypothetical protein
MQGARLTAGHRRRSFFFTTFETLTIFIASERYPDNECDKQQLLIAAVYHELRGGQLYICAVSDSGCNQELSSVRNDSLNDAA